MPSTWIREIGRVVAPLPDALALLGGKAAYLAIAASVGARVPPGFVLTTSAWRAWEAAGRTLPSDMRWGIDRALSELETATSRRLGDPARPLLVSVRGAAPAPFPGGLPTLLNVGLDEALAEKLASGADVDNARFVWDTWQRSVANLVEHTCSVDPFYIEEERRAALRAFGVRTSRDLGGDQLRELGLRLSGLAATRGRGPLPHQPADQLVAAIAACFGSWHHETVQRARHRAGIPDTVGMACLVQSMVFGNQDEVSATILARSRDPATGQPGLAGYWLPRAQGDDVAVDSRDRRPLRGAEGSLAATAPEAFSHIERLGALLEREIRDAVELELTLERGEVWLLQARPMVGEAEARVRVAVDLAEAAIIRPIEAIERVRPDDLERLLHPRIAPGAPQKVLARGLGASPGAATGRLVFTAEAAVAAFDRGESVVLVRHETGPEDVRAMHAAAAILTTRGGITSHAAVVARQLATPCVVGVGSLEVHAAERRIRVGSRVLSDADVVTLDGTSGVLLDGAVALTGARSGDAFARLMSWTDEHRRIAVRANVDSGEEARRARADGATGVGLARTEHMFLQGARIVTMREMILAPNTVSRKAALARLIPEQQRDFEGIFSAMDGLPVTIRLLDPPLHEFLPESHDELAELAALSGREPREVAQMVGRLREANPMLGHRGCRLGVTYPEIYDAQVEAMLRAARAVEAKGVTVRLEVMVPLVSVVEEFRRIRARIDAAVSRDRELGLLATVGVGAMIELPRACLIAGALAESADFLSFGTNDLTQTVFGFSRDDVASFLPAYLHGGVVSADPFLRLDLDGVGALIDLAVDRARAVKPAISLGLCGEHGGDPATIAWLQDRGVSYVSVSPMRVPVARLAAARAAAGFVT